MERFILQPANRKEAEKAMALIDEAKEFLKSQGIDQWQTGYPDMETIIGDLLVILICTVISIWQVFVAFH